MMLAFTFHSAGERERERERKRERHTHTHIHTHTHTHLHTKTKTKKDRGKKHAERQGLSDNQAGYMATPVACGWAGAISEVI